MGPDPQGQRQRLLTAAAWALELDISAQKDIRAGRTVVKRVPGEDPRPSPPLPPRAKAADYLAARPGVGELIRPLLLERIEPAPLLPYQRSGVEWLLERHAAILADDMGLGKTLQAISAIRKLVHEGSSRWALVVAPRTVLATWESELSRWAPELTRMRVTPPTGEREEIWRAVRGRAHVLITNYEQLREPPLALTEQEVDLLVADEAHRMRNLSAAVTRGMRSMRPARFWALTGTPIERDSEDLATLLSLLAPARFSLDDAKASVSTLRSRARPYMLRRRKTDVLPELPEVLETKETLDLLPAQRRAYDRARLGANRSARESHPLRLLNELMSICDYAPESGVSSKIDRITEHLVDIRERGEKAVVFSNYLRPLQILQERLEKYSTPLPASMLTGEMSLPDREAVLERFASDDDLFVLLASMRAASEGLTLTAANHVLFINEWWNPSTNQQARDRVVRLGQERGVRIYRFMCRDTIEETLDGILHRKEALFEQVVEKLVEPESAEGEVKDLLEEVVAFEIRR